MIHVVHLISTFQLKTDTKWLIRLLPAADRNQFTFTVGAFYDDGPAREEFHRLGIRTFNLNMKRTWDFRVVRKLATSLRQLNPDIVHTHLLRADLWGGMAAHRCNKKIVSTIYAQGDYRREKRRPMFDFLLDRWSARYANKFIAVCESIREDLADRVGIPRDTIEVIHTGMNPIHISDQDVERKRMELGISKTAKIVSVVSRLSYEKGVDCFLQAARKVHDADSGVIFLVAGTGELENSLRSVSEKLGLSDVVKFLGFVSAPEVVMKLSKLIVLPSYSEGMPNVVLEALAIGTPVIASRVGGLSDIEKMDSEAVFLVKPNSPNELADAIIRLLDDSDRQKRMIRAGESIINDRLSVVRSAKEYERVYRKLISYE